MMNVFEHVLSQLTNFLWGLPAIVVLLGTGIYLSVRLRAIQCRGFFHAFALISGKYNDPNKKGEITHFSALMTGLSATVGTGNIAGVATAITLGGPGAIFWMWISAIFGMAIKFASCTLAVKFRNVNEQGEVAGGPMYTILNALKKPRLAAAFAFFTVIASFGIGNTVQANSIVQGLKFVAPSLGIHTFWIGLILAILVGVVILGGIRRIAHLTSWMVPIMAAFYFLGSIVIILLHITQLPHDVWEIYNYALNPWAFGGGMMGAAIQFGAARGVFSNEAGLGSSAIAHAAAQTDEPVREGLVAMLEPFFDTLVICSLTAFVVLTTDAWHTPADTMYQSTALVAKAFAKGFGVFGQHAGFMGSWAVGIAVLFFAYSSMVTWSYYGDRAAFFLWGNRAVMVYRILFIVVIILGAVSPLRIVWQFADLANILMAVPNLISLILLTPLLCDMTRRYFQSLAAEN